MRVNFMQDRDDRHATTKHHAADLGWIDVLSVPERTAVAHPEPNEVAATYQPRRELFAIGSIAFNLLAGAALVISGLAQDVYEGLARLGWADYVLTVVYVALLFAAHAIINFPVELWAGYLEERQFGLAKHGIRAWSLDWLTGVGQHAVLFIVGSCLLVMTQALMPHAWMAATAGVLLVLFLITAYLAADLLPVGLFQLEPADEATLRRLRRLLGPDQADHLPPVRIFSSATQRDFAGGLLGLGNRQMLFISRSTIELASDALLRFVLLHEMGHRRMRHELCATLVGWAWIVAGVVLCHFVAPPQSRGTPVFIAWLALTLSTWLAISEPLIAFVGRRIEYAADRYYLRHGGTPLEMRAALTELSRRNIERTDAQSRRRSALRPLPSVGARLHRASVWTANAKERKQGA